MRTKIAIVGYTEHMAQAPFKNEAWEIWSLNDHYNDMRDLNIPLERLRWFQLHKWTRPVIAPDVVTPLAPPPAGPHYGRDPDHLGWMQRWSHDGLRLYTMKAQPELPDAIPYPQQEVFAYFQDGYGNPVRYFTNSISWMLALAIMALVPGGRGTAAVEGAEVGIFGVDMMMGGPGAGMGSEYGYQRPSCEWLLGWAMAAGISVLVPRQSDLLKSAFNYGDEEHEYFRDRLVAYRNEMSKRRGLASNQLSEAQLGHAELTGAINTVDWLMRSHLPGDPGLPNQAGRPPEPNADKELPTDSALTPHGPHPFTGE